MARYTLVYGLRLIPEGSLKGVGDGTLKLIDGSTAGLTLHTFDGTIPQLRRSLDRSLDAFFDLLPGAEDEDIERFGE
ncbi:MAG: allantoinase [Betaproteobacteria bacterium]